MDSALLVHRLHFAFTVTFHYLFPQLTMGLAPLILILKTLAIWNDNEYCDEAARFWAKRLSKWAHGGAAFAVFVGSWLSGFFIIVTDAWMQHPVGYRIAADGSFQL